MKPDKGNGVFILDWKIYNNAIDEITSETSKFESSMRNQPWKVKLHYNAFYVSSNKNFFSENEYDKLYPSGSAPARIYATPKMNKFSSSDSFPKRRPIVSFLGTFNYGYARFVCDLLSPLIPNNYSCKDTFSFVSQFKNVNLSKQNSCFLRCN